MSQPSGGSTRTGSKGLIYVVDDRPDLVEVAKTSLEMAGYSVHGFVNPVSALAALRDRHTPIPALLVTDFDMPEMNGLELIRACRCLHPELKILVLSGTVKESEIMSDSVKVDRFLAKPYQISELTGIVDELIRSTK